MRAITQKTVSAFVSLTVLVVLQSLSQSASAAAPTVTVNTANLAINATTLTITGTNFSTTPANNTVAFSTLGATGTVTASTLTSLTVTFGTKPTATGSLTAIVTVSGNGNSGAAVQVATVVAAPTVTTSAASQAINATTITIAGTNFSTTPANNTVVFNDGAVGSVTASTATSLTVTFSTLPTAVGTLNATVTVFGGSVGPTQVATVVAAPTVTTSTASQPINATTLTIAGTNFSTTPANNTVVFTDGAVGSVTASTATSLTVTFSTLPAAVGTLNATVTVFGGSAGPTQVATVVPVMTTSVATLAANAATLTINGFGFSTTPANNTVAFGTLGATGTVTASAATSLTVTFGTKPTATGSLTAFVTTSGVASGTAVQVATVVAAPTVTSSTASQAINATTITIAGTNFSTTPANNTVVFNDGAAGSVTASTATSLTVTFSTLPTAVGSLTANVTVFGGSTGAIQVATVVPVVTTSAANLAANATSLVINGFGFSTTPANNTVAFGTLGAVGTVTASTATSLTVTFSTLPTTAGSLTAAVTTSGASSGTAVQVATVIPVVTTSAANLAINASTMVINGFGFSTTPTNNTVAFGTLGATGTVTASTATSLTLTFGTKPTATGSLTAAVTANGVSSGTAVQVATVVAAPTVTTSAASQAINATTLTIAGTNFSTTPANNTVAFNDGAVGSVIASTANSLTVNLTIQPTAVGSLTANVTVFGGSTGAIQVATVVPVVTTSAANLAANVATVTINGFGFSATPANNTVTFTDGAVGTVTTASATSLTVTFSTKPTNAGSLTAVVTVSGVSSGAAIQVATVIPVVTSSIANISTMATTVTINGFGFASTNASNSVAFSTLGAVGSVTTSTPTQIIVTFSTQPTVGSLTAVVTSNSQSSGAAVQVATVVAPPVITTLSLANWTLNKSSYSQTIAATGTGALTFSITSGSLPTGLALTPSTGLISGTPTIANTFNFTVTATDAFNGTGSQAYSATINPAILVTPTTAPNWTANGTGYFQPISSTGGTGAVTFAVTAGALPGGLTLSGGQLAGTPTAAGTFNFTITGTDAVGATGSLPYTVIINPAVTITTANLPNWTVNQSGYSQTITSTGGTGASTFTVTSGALPGGLTLAGTGLLSGTPTAAGTFNFTVTATDTVLATGAQAYTIIVNPAVTVTPASLPNWTINQSGYSQTITSANGTGAVTLSLSAGAVPTGMTFTPATGVLNGTPTTAGTYPFTITATDSVGATGSKGYTIIINPVVAISTTTLPNWTVGKSGYAQTLTTTGGTGTITFTTTSGTLPGGLTFTGAVLSGTPSSAGTFNFTVTVTDAAGATGTQPYTIVINPAVALAPATLPNWTVNTASYSQTITSTNGTGARTLRISSGAVPTGLTFVPATGVLSGTPTATGTFNFTITATDTVGATGSQAYSIIINAAISIATTALPSWTLNTSYNQTITKSGGTGAATFAVTTGTLPAGLTLASTGVLSGAPTATGTSSFTVTATDTIGGTASQGYTIIINPAPAINTTTLPNWTVNKSGYTQTIAHTGGTSPSTFAVTTGAQPGGLALSNVGLLSGTPNVANTFTFTVTMTDAAGATASQSYTVIINPAVTVSPTSLPSWTANQSGYSQNITSSGGTGARRIVATAGAIPDGLTFIASTGLLFGTPTTAATFKFTITATDSIGAQGVQVFNLTINPPLAITPATLPNWTLNQAGYSQAVSVTGGTGAAPLTISAGTLPTGLTLSNGGLLSGTPTVLGTYNFTLSATDTVGATASQAYTIIISPAPPTVTTPTSASVTGSSAILGGNVVADGGAAITEIGVVYSPTAINGAPQVGGSGVVDAIAAGSTGVFTVKATSLIPATAYSFAAYATNSQGTSYSTVGTFTTVSSDAALGSLTVSPLALSPAFAGGNTAYTATASNLTTSVTVIAAVAEPHATLQVNGVTVASGTTSGAITLNTGVNSINVVVTAQDGTTTTTYTVTVTRKGSYISVQQPVGNSLVNNISTTGFGGAGLGETTTRAFAMKNLSATALTNFIFSFDGANPGDFTVTTQPATNLAAGASTTFVVTFRPLALGDRSATMQIDATGETQNPFIINLTGTGVAAPAITTPPASQIVALGQSASFTTVASGGDLSYQWLKNGAAIAGATKNTYGFLSATLANAGAYSVNVSNAAGSPSAPNPVANLGVVNQHSATLTLVNGNTITLTVSAAAPGISYQWQKNGSDLVDGPNPATGSLGTISGAKTSKLSITKSIAADAAGYTCVISMPDPQHPASPISLPSGLFTVNITVKPVLGTFSPGPWIVSGTVTDSAPCQNNPTSFTLTGQPPGVTIDANGHLHGKPAASGTFHLTITASNAAGTSLLPAKADVTVAPLPTNALGTFNGLVARDPFLSSGHGGTLSVTTLLSGVFSGKLTLGPASYPFTAQHLDASTTPGADPTAHVVIARRRPLPDLTLDLAFLQATGELTGTVTNGVIATPVSIDAWRNPWSVTPTQAVIYTSELELGHDLSGTGSNPGNLAYPQGAGYGTLSITTAGAATWSGRMADGAVTTCSTTLGPAGQVPLHFMLYTNTGSAHGWVTASADTSTPQANNGLRLLDGSIDWFKSKAATSADRTYNAGIPLNTLTVIGGEYAKPTSTVLGLPSGLTNAQLNFSEGGLTGPAPIVGAVHAADPDVSFGITSANALVMPSVANNPAGLTLNLNANTGAFNGSFMLKGDQDPSNAKTSLLTRTVYYYGLLVPRLSVNQGLGYFLLQELPAAAVPANPPAPAIPKTTLLTSPILSGLVILDASK